MADCINLATLPRKWRTSQTHTTYHLTHVQFFYGCPHVFMQNQLWEFLSYLLHLSTFLFWHTQLKLPFIIIFYSFLTISFKMTSSGPISPSKLTFSTVKELLHHDQSLSIIQKRAHVSLMQHFVSPSFHNSSRGFASQGQSPARKLRPAWSSTCRLAMFCDCTARHYWTSARCHPHTARDPGTDLKSNHKQQSDEVKETVVTVQYLLRERKKRRRKHCL